MRRGGVALEDPYPGKKHGGMEKAVEAEYTLVPPGVMVVWGSKWKSSRVVEWEELMEWRFPITTHSSSSMEQFREKFGGLVVQGTTSPRSVTMEGGMRTAKLLAVKSLPLPQPMVLSLAGVTGLVHQGAVAASSPAGLGQAPPHPAVTEAPRR